MNHAAVHCDSSPSSLGLCPRAQSITISPSIGERPGQRKIQQKKARGAGTETKGESQRVYLHLGDGYTVE